MNGPPYRGFVLMRGSSDPGSVLRQLKDTLKSLRGAGEVHAVSGRFDFVVSFEYEKWSEYRDLITALHGINFRTETLFSIDI